MKVISSVHSIKMLCVFFLFTLFSVFTSFDANAQCNTDPTSGPVSIVINLNGSTAVLDQAALIGVINPVDDGATCTDCELWFQASGEMVWESSYLLSCDGSTSYADGTYQVVANDEDPDLDPTCQSAEVELTVILQDVNSPDIDVSSTSTPDCGEDLGPLNTSQQYDYTGGGTVVSGGFPSNCLTRLNWDHPDFDDNCLLEELQIKYTAGIPAPDELPDDVTVNGDANIKALNGTGTTAALASSSSDGNAVTTITYMLTDSAGNVTNCSFDVEVVDDEDPSITCALDASLSTGDKPDDEKQDCGYTISDMSYDATATDNCSVVSLTHNYGSAPNDTTLMGAEFPIGTTTVIWTATDGAGRTDDCMIDITVTDGEDPLLACPADVTVDNDPGLCSATGIANIAMNYLGSDDPSLLPVGTAQWYDNCSNADITYTLNGAASSVTVTDGNIDAGQETFDVGITTVEYTVTDDQGNTNSCSFTVTVEDNENPVINDCAMSIDSIGTDLFSCDAFYTWEAPSDLQDNCGLASFTCEVTDNEDNIVNTFNTVPSDCSNQVGFAGEWAPGFWTLSGPGSANTSNAPGSVSVTGASGGTTRLCIDVPDDGQIAFNFNVSPFIGFSAYSVNGASSIIGSLQPNGSRVVPVMENDDFCFEVASAIFIQRTLTISNFQFTCSENQKNATLPKGTNLITYTLTDIHGNDTTCVDTVVVYDDEAPTMEDCDDKEMNTVCPDATIPDYTTNNNLSDNCPMVVVTQSPDPNVTLGDLETMDSIYFNGMTDTLQDGAYYFVTLVATDMGGNTDTCRFQVTLRDLDAPIPDVDPLQDINPMTTLGTDCGSYTLCAPTATDCNGTVIYGTATIAGATYDPNGCGAGMPAYTFTLPGVWSISWNYDDGNGNSATQLQNVRIEADTIAPTVNAPTNVVASTDPGVCTKANILGISMTEVFPTIAPYLDPTELPSNGEGIDNCGIVEWSYQLSGATTSGVIDGTDAGTQTFNLGTTTVTYFAEDAEGNVGSDSFEVEVEDNEDPTAACPAMMVSLQLADDGDDTDCVFTFTNTNYDPKSVNDNCSIADTMVSLTGSAGVVITQASTTSLQGTTIDLSGTSNNSGTVTANWTITDGSGNTVNCETTFTIEDLTPPTITCADDGTRQISMDATPADCFYTVQGNEFDPIATDDNCMVDNLANDQNGSSTLDGVNLPIGKNIITWTIQDKYGNSANCEVEINVEDDVPPIFDYCPSDITLNNTPGDCSQLHNWVQPNVYDLTDCDPALDLTITREVSDPSVQAALNANYPYDDEIGGFALSEFPVGMTFVYYIAEDSWGNMDTCTMKVTIVDNEAPVFAVCPIDQILGNICADDIVPDYTGLSTVTDNCGSFTLIQDPAPGTLLSNVPGLTPADGESFLVTLTATDSDSAFLSTDCTFTVTLQDNAAPEPDIAGATLPKEYNSCGEVIVTAPTATDCGDIIYGVPDKGTFLGGNPPMYSFTTGLYNVNWTYTDNDNNTATQNQIIEVDDDTTAPELTCPIPAAMYGTNYPECSATNILGIALSEGTLGSFTPGTYADTCTTDPNFIIEYQIQDSAGAVIVARNNNGNNAGTEVFPVGENTVTYYVTDEAGNESECSFTVMVMDDDAPDLAVPPDVTVQCDNVPVAPAGSANDNCDGLFVPQFMEDSIPGSCINEYTLERTWTAVDVKGNSIALTQVITVIDTKAPNFNLNLGSLDVTTSNDLNECSAVVSLIMDPADVTDGCDNNVTITNDYTFGGNDASGVYPVGTTTVTFTAEDNCGNSSTYEVDVTVIDNEDPIIGCLQGLAFNLPDTDTLVLRPSDLYFVLRDNCDIDTVTMSQDTFTCEDVTMQFIDVILTATDIHGNEGTCTATVLIEDNIPPVALCRDINAYLEADGQVTVDATAIDGGSTDNCDFALDYYIGTIGTKTETFDCADKGLNVRTLIVQDPSGNVDSCTAEIIVRDTIRPVAQCANKTIALDSFGFATIGENFVDGGSTDNCNMLTYDTDITNFNCSDIGTNVVKLTVTDMSGNKDSCDAIVTVIDNIAPIAICANPTIYLDDNGEVTLDESDIDGGSTDNCDNDLSFSFDREFSCADTGINMVQVTVTDDYNNSSVCTSEVTVLDTTPPIAACMDATLILDSAGFAVLNVNDIWDAPNSSDNCAIEHARLSQTIFDCSNKNQMNPVTLELEDYSGNTSTCEANITVLDVFGPHLECRDITVLVDENTDASIFATSVIDSVFDPCGLQDTTISKSVFDCSDAGDNTVTVTATDFTGNVSVCQANVRVEFTTPPNAVCRDITVNLGEDGTPGQATISPTDIDAGSEDACGETTGLIRSINMSSFDCDDIGDQIVTLTVTDRFGVSSTCTSTVTVEGAPLELSIADVSGAQGDIITVPITAEQFVEITSLQFTVEVNDPSVARIVNTDVIDPQTGATFTLIDEDTAAYNFFSSGGNDVANGDTIATMDVELLGVVGESTPLSFTSSFQKMEWSSDCQENTGKQDLIQANDGSATITSSPAIYSVSGNVRHWADDIAIENVPVQISYGGVPADTVYTNFAGEYSFTAVNGSSPEICPININSGYYATERDFYLAKTSATQSVTAFDQLLLARHIANLPGARFNNPFELIAADVSETPTGTTCNGSEIDGADIRTIGTVLEGASNWTHESWVFVDTAHSFSNPLCPWEGSGYPECIEIPSISSNQTDLDFNAVKIGDVDGTFDHSTLGPNGGSDINPADLQLEYRASANEAEFNMSNVLPIGSFQFALNYDPSETFIESTEILSTADNFVINHQPDQNRILIIAYDLNFDEMGQETLFRLYGDFSGSDNEFRIKQDYLINEVYSEIDEFGIVVLKNALSTNVEDNVIGHFELLQNRPNPFNQQTMITWIMPQNEEVTLSVYNVFGQVVHTKVLDGKAGMNNYELSLQNLPASGTYYYQVQTANYEATKSMLLVD